MEVLVSHVCACREKREEMKMQQILEQSYSIKKSSNLTKVFRRLLL